MAKRSKYTAKLALLTRAYLVFHGVQYACRWTWAQAMWIFHNSDWQWMNNTCGGMLPRLALQLPGVKNGLVLMRFEWHYKLSFSASTFETCRSLKLIDRWDEWMCVYLRCYFKRKFIYFYWMPLNWNVMSVKCYPKKHKRKIQC